MCRYSDPMYRSHWACFDCRKSWKQATWINLNYAERKCPECGEFMSWMGHDFHAPRKQNKSQWEKVRRLVEKGIKFHSCGCEGPGPRPKTLTALKYGW